MNKVVGTLELPAMVHYSTATTTTCQFHDSRPHPILTSNPTPAFSFGRPPLNSKLTTAGTPTKPLCTGHRHGLVRRGKHAPALCCTTSSATFRRTGGVQALPVGVDGEISKSKRRLFFLDVNPLCYNGSTPSLRSFARWIDLFFSQVSLRDPVVAVIDGEGGNEYRKMLLPSYKAHRMKFSNQRPGLYTRVPVERSHQTVIEFLKSCNVPVIKVEGCEADDVVATLVEQVLQKGFKAVIASPDKDFKQLISEDVQLVIPLPELGRWSFYTLKHYLAQYNCDPSSDLSLRCILGDKVDGVPGIQDMVPNFGRNIALKLLKKHGSLESLLNTAAVRTVGKQYVQDALTKYSDHLLKNYKVLSLRRDIDVNLEDTWLCERDTSNDSVAVAQMLESLEEAKKWKYKKKSHSPSR